MLSQEELDFNLRWTDEELCRACKGFCCQKNACDSAPSDFGYDISRMEKALESGNYSIVFARTTPNAFITTSSGQLTLSLQHILDSYDETLYIRPRNQNRPIVDLIHQPGSEGPCIFWSLEKGCSLSYEERPMFGRSLIPSPLGHEFCHDIYPTRLFIVLYWKPYTEQLYELAKKYFPKDWELYHKFNFTL